MAVWMVPYSLKGDEKIVSALHRMADGGRGKIFWPRS